MPLRSMPNTIEALRLTLLNLEQTTNATEGSEHLGELKRIILHRIAELEATSALESASLNAVPPVDTATVPMAATMPVDPAASSEEPHPNSSKL
jgi:hypothetical protein